jgi:hypothetical protein
MSLVWEVSYGREQDQHKSSEEDGGGKLWATYHVFHSATSYWSYKLVLGLGVVPPVDYLWSSLSTFFSWYRRAVPGFFVPVGGGKAMTLRERLDAANDKFHEKCNWTQDEWTETFLWGVVFARRLMDYGDTEQMLAEQVIQWLEAAAELLVEE